MITAWIFFAPLLPVALLVVLVWLLAQVVGFLIVMTGFTISGINKLIRWTYREVKWLVSSARRRLATRVR